MGKSKLWHMFIEIIFVFICVFIGRFEDTFVMAAFVLAFLYNLLYVFLLRDKGRETIGRAFANIVYIWAMMLNVFSVIYMGYVAIFGYRDGPLFAAKDQVYYGIEAWTNNLLVVCVIVPGLLINTVYLVLYHLIERKMKK